MESGLGLVAFPVFLIPQCSHRYIAMLLHDMRYLHALFGQDPRSPSLLSDPKSSDSIQLARVLQSLPEHFQHGGPPLFYPVVAQPRSRPLKKQIATHSDNICLLTLKVMVGLQGVSLPDAKAEKAETKLVRFNYAVAIK